MKTKITVIFLALILFGSIVSCATTPIEELYPERWERTKLGMTLEEFKQVWPEAKYNGTGDLEGKSEIYTVSKSGLAASVQMEYFTFQDSKLIKFRGSGTY
jgi:hypothetical protein